MYTALFKISLTCTVKTLFQYHPKQNGFKSGMLSHER